MAQKTKSARYDNLASTIGSVTPEEAKLAETAAWGGGSDADRSGRDSGVERSEARRLADHLNEWVNIERRGDDWFVPVAIELGLAPDVCYWTLSGPVSGPWHFGAYLGDATAVRDSYA